MGVFQLLVFVTIQVTKLKVKNTRKFINENINMSISFMLIFVIIIQFILTILEDINH